MKIIAAANQGQILDFTKGVCRTSVWLLYADSPDTAPETFHAEAAAWCGDVGGNIRIPTADGTPAELENCPVEKIELRSMSQLAYEVTFSSRCIRTSPVFSESRSSDGKCRRTAKYTVKTSSPETVLPAPGSLLEWNGEEFYCESASYTPAGEGLWSFEVTGVPVIGRICSLPEINTDSDGRRTVSCKWLVSAAEYNDLLETLVIDAPAPWAGEGFSVRQVSSRSDGVNTLLVTATAGEAETRMIKCIRSERFAGFDDDGNPLRSIVYESIWHVRTEEMEDFTGITGTAASWAEENAVVCSVKPERLSAHEYRLVITAEPLTNPDLHERYSVDDRSNLSDRNDVSARMTEFMLTPEMAGWRSGFDGQRELCPDWQYGEHCPLTVTEALPETMLDRALKCALLEETVYYSGGMSRNIDRLLEWSTADRVFNGKIGGCSGSYLRVDMEAEEVFDNHGRRWTRFTGSWQRAPGDYQWNPQYWGKI